uniref:Uncharacterized protein n=1 Tax=Tanacetum cinerariifolium TaxID=118510 RepID=A0A699WDA9_TANCI|nr:hypothetical protein [Tanacetum cinerariifolium]
MSKFQAQEEEIGRLKERVQVLEDREDSPIKGRSNNEGEAATERIKRARKLWWSLTLQRRRNYKNKLMHKFPEN